MPSMSIPHVNLRDVFRSGIVGRIFIGQSFDAFIQVASEVFGKKLDSDISYSGEDGEETEYFDLRPEMEVYFSNLKNNKLSINMITLYSYFDHDSISEGKKFADIDFCGLYLDEEISTAMEKFGYEDVVESPVASGIPGMIEYFVSNYGRLEFQNDDGRYYLTQIQLIDDKN